MPLIPVPPFSVKVGSRQVVASGSVVQLGSEPIQFLITDLIVEMNFVSDDTKVPTIQGHPTSDRKRMILTVANFDNPLGVHWQHKIGDLSGRPLYLALMVHSVGEAPTASRSVQYTFSVEDAA
jgi:hypothetical protein